MPDPIRYALSPSASELTVRVFKDASSLAARLSHDHVIQATQLSGTFTWSEDPTTCALDVSVPVAGLLVDPPHLRARLGMGAGLSDKEKRDTDKNMRDKAQLWASRFPVITFRSRASAATSGGLRLTADVGVRGMSISRSVDVVVQVTDGRVTIDGGFKARATDFGFRPFSALLGALKNQDEMVFYGRLVGLT